MKLLLVLLNVTLFSKLSIEIYVKDKINPLDLVSDLRISFVPYRSSMLRG